uniref:protein SUPPRESSOR OF GENE SILENCING 3-like n=1 Tax=Erigeron canadensis TaxID=72917 RepID=UPI001CB92A17|nr:protein SUPPRESSOR OF GENE SILENCING 3-like [Erigeron canadensis]
MTLDRVNRPSADVVDQLNTGLGNMSLNSGQRKGWEDSTIGYVTGDGSRLNWATWAEAKKKAGKWGDDNNVENIEDDDENDVDESDEDGLVSDDYDSDDSQKSHDSRKKNPWLAEFFSTLDGLTAEQIVEPARQWHCPACRDGPGSIHWFRGMKSFVTHVKTKGTRRPRLHWDFAELLDEELRRRGATLVKAGESYGKWKGLDKETEDREIVWPPMVIVMNTQLEKDENEKWLGMGPQELLEYFESYEAVKARSSFGPEGHRGMSVLIFDTSAIGYLEAERLSNHFVRQGVDRDAWNRHPYLLHPDGKRQLYGFMAKESDLDAFNQHSPGKLKLKSELVSYQEKVVDKLKQLNKDSEQLIWYKKKIAKQERSSKALEDAFWLLSEKLRKIEEENKLVRQRTKKYHEQNQEEMDFQENFFKEQIQVIQDARDAHQKEFEQLQQKECKIDGKSCEVADAFQSKENVEELVKSQAKEIKEIEEERERLMKLHEEEVAEMKSKHGNEEIEMEQKFNSKLDQLMVKLHLVKG